jgi:2-keto-3-deoxy-L-rhamnonate aldolase RhmA
MVASSAEAKDFADLGASAFIISSDQGQMRRAAAQALSDFNKLIQIKPGSQEKSHVSQH